MGAHNLEKQVQAGHCNHAEHHREPRYVNLEEIVKNHNHSPASQKAAQQISSNLVSALAVDSRHHHHDSHHYGQHPELTQFHSHQQRVGKLHCHHENHHGPGCSEEHQAAHAFAVKHKEKRKIHQGRPRLMLHKNEDDREHYDEKCLHIVGKLRVELEIVSAEELSQSQGRGELAEFGRLQAHRAKHQPRARALDVRRDEGRRQQHHHKHRIYGIGISLIHARLDQQQHKAHDQP